LEGERWIAIPTLQRGMSFLLFRTMPEVRASLECGSYCENDVDGFGRAMQGGT